MQHIKPREIKGKIAPLSLANQNAVSTDLTCSVHDNAESIFGLSEIWLALERISPDTVLFQSFAWCRNHLDFSKGDNSFQPLVFMVYANGAPLLILPLCLQSKGRMKVLTGLSEPFQQYTDVLADRVLVETIGREAVGDCLIKAIRRTDADYLHLGQVRQDSMLAFLLDGMISLSGEEDAAPFVPISQFADHGSYRKSINAKTRKNLRNARNRLERDAPVTHEVARSGRLMQEVVARAYAGREAWLEELGITSRAFENTDFEAFLTRFGLVKADTGVETIAMSLMHGETPISDQWGFVYRGRYYAFMATFNPAFEGFSPGRLHLGEVIRTCFEEGFSTTDFMIPASSYKLSWTDQVVAVRDYVLPLSLKGTAYTRLWLDFARPMAKKMFFALPVGLRGKLLGFVLR